MTPKFITIKGSTRLTSDPYYAGLVQHESVMTKRETYAHLASRLEFSEANVRAAFLGLKKYLMENANRGNISFLDGISSIRNIVRGSFATTNGPWIKGRNYLMVASIELDPFKSTLAGVIPTNRTEGATPAISSVLDSVTGVYDVITGVDEFVIAGTDLGPDTSKDDEYVGFLSKTGTLTKATGINLVTTDAGASVYLENTLGTTFPCTVVSVISKQEFTFRSNTLLEGGDYKLWVKSRGGDAEGPLQATFRKVKYLKVVDVPTVTKIATEGKEGIVKGSPFEILGTNLRFNTGDSVKVSWTESGTPKEESLTPTAVTPTKMSFAAVTAFESAPDDTELTFEVKIDETKA